MWSMLCYSNESLLIIVQSSDNKRTVRRKEYKSCGSNLIPQKDLYLIGYCDITLLLNGPFTLYRSLAINDSRLYAKAKFFLIFCLRNWAALNKTSKRNLHPWNGGNSLWKWKGGKRKCKKKKKKGSKETFCFSPYWGKLRQRPQTSTCLGFYRSQFLYADTERSESE